MEEIQRVLQLLRLITYINNNNNNINNNNNNNNNNNCYGCPWSIFGPKRDENGEWKRLHNEECNGLYPSHNLVRVIKSRRLRWAGHVARMRKIGVLSKC